MRLPPLCLTGFAGAAVFSWALASFLSLLPWRRLLSSLADCLLSFRAWLGHQEPWVFPPPAAACLDPASSDDQILPESANYDSCVFPFPKLEAVEGSG